MIISDSIPKTEDELILESIKVLDEQIKFLDNQRKKLNERGQNENH